jgi:hypothetical protein
MNQSRKIIEALVDRDEIIGHTQSGRPVYIPAHGDYWGEFSAQDHEDARKLHADIMGNLPQPGVDGFPPGTSSNEKARWEVHQKQAQMHATMALGYK